MREGKKFKKLLIGVAAAAMTMLCTLPVSAATKSFKPITVKAGRCIHLLNTNIQSNAITNYSYRIQPQSSGTRYDIVYAYGGEAEALKGARTDSGQIINNTYIKSSTSSNQGMIACLKVTSGSVKLSVKITSPNAKSKITAAYQSSSHSPLKNTRTIKKGQWIKMTRTGSNLSTLPLIVAAKKGANINRRLNTTSYENYSFKSKYVAFRPYTNKKGGKLYKRKYLTTNGRTKYHFMLIPQLTVLENIILGSEPCRFKLNRKKAREQVQKLIDTYHFQLDVNQKVADLSVGMKQRVEILKLLYRKANVIIFDEPTAVLTPQEVEELFLIFHRLVDSGCTVIFITHKPNEIFAVSERVTVLRKGKCVGTAETAKITPEQLSEMMVGRQIEEITQLESVTVGKPVLTLDQVRLMPLAKETVSLQVREREIVGIAKSEAKRS